MKIALITGVAGQDGYYLALSLLKDGYTIHGTVLPGIPARRDLDKRIILHEVDLREHALLSELVLAISPSEVYYLAAHHFPSQGNENCNGLVAPFLAVNVIAPNIILELIKSRLPATRFFYAASSHIFGSPVSFPQTESTPYNPSTPYAISKSSGVMLCRYYRETYGLHISSGILYNHESPLRPADFVTTRIARAAALASIGKKEEVRFKNLSAVVDWGAAKDYVTAMRLLLKQSHGGEYIISSGIPRTVLEFAEMAFYCVGLKPDGIITQEAHPLLHSGVPYVGDNSKISKLGWVPSITFEELVREMVIGQLETLQN